MAPETEQGAAGRSRSDDSGRYVETYPTDKFLAALKTDDGIGTAAVARHVGCSYETAYKRLKDLDANGAVTHRKIGNTYLWLHNDE